MGRERNYLNAHDEPNLMIDRQPMLLGAWLKKNEYADWSEIWVLSQQCALRVSADFYCLLALVSGFQGTGLKSRFVLRFRIGD